MNELSNEQILQICKFKKEQQKKDIDMEATIQYSILLEIINYIEEEDMPDEEILEYIRKICLERHAITV